MKNIKLLILDVDGVLTNGSIFIGPNGEEYKMFSVLDGYGLNQLRQAGIEVAIISGRNSTAVNHHLARFGITHIYQGQHDKLTALRDLLGKLQLTASQAAYVGDDIPDLVVMREVGLPIAVANAVPTVQQQAHWVTQKRGGEGAVREVCDFLMREISVEQTV